MQHAQVWSEGFGYSKACGKFFAKPPSPWSIFFRFQTCQVYQNDPHHLLIIFDFFTFGRFGRFCAIFGAFRRFFGTIGKVSSSYEIWYPICPPSSKDIGMLTKKPQIWLFWGRFWRFCAVWGRIWAIFWYHPMRPVELRILVPNMPT